MRYTAATFRLGSMYMEASKMKLSIEQKQKPLQLTRNSRKGLFGLLYSEIS